MDRLPRALLMAPSPRQAAFLVLLSQVVSPRVTLVVVMIASVSVSGCGGASRTIRASSAAAIGRLPRGSRACRTSQLKIATINSGAGLSKAWAYIGFTNASRRECELAGWPRLVAITKTGEASTARDVVPPSAFPITSSKVPASIVKLAPGRRADIAFLAADGAATRCPPAFQRLRVTPPGNTQSVLLSAWVPYLGAYLPNCSTIWVSPVVPPGYLQKS